MNRIALSLALVGVAGVAAAQGLRVGDKVPSFSVVGPDGKQVFLKDMQNAGSPIFLFFINDRDGTSASAAGYINKIAGAYTPSKVKWYGIINAREDRLRSYQSEMNPPYQLYMDPTLSAVQTFKAQGSPYVVLINKSGRVAHIWNGYSGANLKDLNRAVARANGRKVASIDFRRTPSTVQYGRGFITQPGAAGGG